MTIHDHYLAEVTAHLAPPAPPQAWSFTEPRALLRALNFLDVTDELVFGETWSSGRPWTAPASSPWTSTTKRRTTPGWSS
ncbi:hypothetical protein [Streptomyces sp. NPDC059994]|uniref:hypothetical protein n=1 Tax=Streptomyces sp. NPDC059994 TaxID=3347029 RepID=UPI00367C56DE